MLDQARKLANRVRLAVTKALIEKVDDSTALQLLKIKMHDGEVKEEVERLQGYGLTSNPPEQSEAIAVEVGGARDNVVVIVVDSATNRIKDLKVGEVCLYAEFGQTIKLDENNEILFDSGKHVFNGGDRAAARQDDETISTGLEDESFWTWVATVTSALTGLGVTMPDTPLSLTGKINAGSASVRLPND